MSGIAWTSWTASSAQGNGTWEYDDCNPSCAQGISTPYPATVKLTSPAGGQFTQLTEIQSGPHGQTSTYTLPSTFIGGPS